MANNHKTLDLKDLFELAAERLFKCCAIISHMCVLISQINGLADQPHIGTTRPSTANTRVEHRRFLARVGANQLNHLRGIDVFNAGRANISRAVTSRQLCTVRAAFDVSTLPFNKLLQRKGRFHRRKISDKARYFTGAFDFFARKAQGLAPARGTQLAVFANIGRIQALAAQTVPYKTGFV